MTADAERLVASARAHIVYPTRRQV